MQRLSDIAPLFKQLSRFGITGSCAAIVHYLTVIAIVQSLKADPLLVNIIGFGCGFVISFLGHRYWTFSHSQRHIILSLPLFLTVATINLILNQSLFYICLRILQIHYTIALAIVLATMAASTFLFSKHWVFKH